MPSNHCGGGRGPTGLIANDLWTSLDEVQQNSTSIGGGYRVLLKLPINTDEAHRSDRVVIVDMPLPAWGETKLARNKASRPLGSKRASGKKEAGTYDPTIRLRQLPKP